MKKALKIFDYLIIFTLMFLILVFIVFPFLKVFISSFYINGNFTLEGFNFLKNSKKLVYNSIFVAVFTTILTLIISLSIGIFAYASKKITRKIISFLLMITMISPPFVSSLSYIKLFGRRGFITHDILKLSIDPYGAFGIILMQSIGLVSISALMIISSLDTIDTSQIDSARSLGAKTKNVIFDHLIFLLMPTIKVVMILSFIRSIADFSTPLIIGGSFETLSSRSYITFISDGNILTAGAMNVILTLPVIFTFIFYIKNTKILNSVSSGTNSCEKTLNKKNFTFFIVTFICILFLTLLILQYFSIILSAFTDYERGKIYFTLEHFKEIKNYIDKTVFRSVCYAIFASVFGSIIGLLLEYYVCIRDKKFLKIFDFFASVPYILPGTFFGIGYILAFNKKPLYLTGTALIVILNITFKSIPFSTKLFNKSIKAIENYEILSSKDLGANEFFVFKDVVLQNVRNDFVISMINIFNSSMTTVGSIIFLVYPSKKLLTLVMFDVINSGKYNIASVIALLIILICLFFSFLFILLNFLFTKIGGMYVFRSKKSV